MPSLALGRPCFYRREGPGKTLSSVTTGRTLLPTELQELQLTHLSSVTGVESNWSPSGRGAR